MTENLQADCVQSRQAGFMQCFLCPKTAVPRKQSDFHQHANRPEAAENLPEPILQNTSILSLRDRETPDTSHSVPVSGVCYI